MALNTKIRGAQIADAVAGVGLAKDGSDNFKVDLNEVPAIGDAANTSDYFIFVDATDNATKKYTVGNFQSEAAGNGLSASGKQLVVNVDGSSIELSGDALQVKALGITNAMLAGSIAYSKLSLTGEILNADLAGSIADGKLAEDYIKTAEVDNATIEFSSATLSIKDGGVDTAQLAADAVDATKIEDDAIGGEHINAGAESAGYVLTTNGSGTLTWTAKTDISEDYLQEAEIKFEDESANCNGSTVAFTLGSSPVTNSVQVFLNGLLQQEGSGKDYVLAGTTITFATAPASADILLVHYIAT